MGTLDHWKSRLVIIPTSIECPEMVILSGRDGEPPVLVGPGHLDIKSSTEIVYTMFVASDHGDEASVRLMRARESPYELLDQFRLIATDYEGNEWACGWTRPELKEEGKKGWLLTGTLSSLVAVDSGPSVSTEAGVELMFLLDSALAIGNRSLSSFFVQVSGGREGRKRGGQTLRVLGSKIRFSCPSPTGSFLVTARTSQKLPHPYLENWIGEPLRILTGQLMYPRLVARNFGDGKAQVSLRPSPRQLRNSGIVALFGARAACAGKSFWMLYKDLVRLIAEARDEQGHPNFESHPITRFYEEIMQATHGSRWVMCLTLASSVEGLANMLMTARDRKSDFDVEDIESLRAVVAAWKGNAALRSRVLSSISYVGNNAGAYLRRLVSRGVLESAGVDAWTKVRNSVMHGKLVTPWGSEEDDKRIAALAELVHRLTCQLISRRRAAPVKCGG